nr:hypothetical protein Q903MT_gene5223 [Picea sitchensis]
MRKSPLRPHSHLFNHQLLWGQKGTLLKMVCHYIISKSFSFGKLTPAQARVDRSRIRRAP